MKPGKKSYAMISTKWIEISVARGRDRLFERDGRLVLMSLLRFATSLLPWRAEF